MRKRVLPLSARNAETAAVSIHHLETLVHEGLSVIAKQNDTLVMLIRRVGALENALNIQKMHLTGLGPTVVPNDGD